MDTSIAATSTGALGRPTAPRRMRTVEEKRRIVEETMKRGASVARRPVRMLLGKGLTIVLYIIMMSVVVMV